MPTGANHAAAVGFSQGARELVFFLSLLPTGRRQRVYHPSHAAATANVRQDLNKKIPRMIFAAAPPGAGHSPGAASHRVVMPPVRKSDAQPAAAPALLGADARTSRRPSFLSAPRRPASMVATSRRMRQRVQSASSLLSAGGRGRRFFGLSTLIAASAVMVLFAGFPLTDAAAAVADDAAAATPAPGVPFDAPTAAAAAPSPAAAAAPTARPSAAAAAAAEEEDPSIKFPPSVSPAPAPAPAPDSAGGGDVGQVEDKPRRRPRPTNIATGGVARTDQDVMEKVEEAPPAPPAPADDAASAPEGATAPATAIGPAPAPAAVAPPAGRTSSASVPASSFAPSPSSSYSSTTSAALLPAGVEEDPALAAAIPLPARRPEALGPKQAPAAAGGNTVNTGIVPPSRPKQRILFEGK